MIELSTWKKIKNQKALNSKLIKRQFNLWIEQSSDMGIDFQIGAYELFT